MSANIRHADLFGRTPATALVMQCPVLVIIVLTGFAIWRLERCFQIAGAGLLILLMPVVVLF